MALFKPFLIDLATPDFNPQVQVQFVPYNSMNDILKMGGGEIVLLLGEINRDDALLSLEALDNDRTVLVLKIYST